MFNAMCDDLDNAKANRARVKEGFGNAFYDQQANAVAQWQLGELPPESVVLGSLPEVSLKHTLKHIRQDEGD